MASPLCVIDAKSHTVVIPEVELDKVAVEVVLCAVLIDALHAALEDGEVALNSVGVDDAADVLALPVGGGLMVNEGWRGLEVHAGLIGVQRRFLGDVLLKDRDDVMGLRSSTTMERT